ncbi:hypothetical protein GCM10009680_74190 [Streptomyces yatensis]|uniref:Uncharacterized protein n=1 Tax=Streptomyces yatensis TaxID=155177 RepID=A0ABP4VDM8_9ACTN
MLKEEIERETARRGGDEKRYVRKHGADELCGEEHEHREQRRQLYDPAWGDSGRGHGVGSWQEGEGLMGGPLTVCRRPAR